MLRTRTLFLPALVLALAGNAGVDSLRDRIISSARACDPTRLTFDRTTVSERHGPGINQRSTRVERWDGRQWSLVSIDGRVPNARELDDARKAQARLPVPGYHRIADLVAAATDTRLDDQGRTILTIPVLPAGSVRTDSGDISRHLKGEAVVVTAGRQPWVQQLKVTAREPFKLNFLITVKSFEQVSDYRLSDDGQPRLASQVADSQGSMFGYTGGQKSQTVYAYR